jgi:type VI secretion system protein ImpI/type VI secretion system protein
MMLTLSILRCPDAVPPQTRMIEGGEFRIGRGPDNDWVLSDTDRVLSKRHCVIAFRSGVWQLADTSTNGTFLNREADPVGPGAVRTLEDGDRLRLGAYEVEVRLASQPRFGQGGGAAPARFDDPFGDDPFSTPTPPSARPSGFGDPGFGASLFDQADHIAMPQSDPFTAGFGAPPAGAGFGQATQADHTPSQSDAFRPPPIAPRVLPDDWDLDLGLAPRSQPNVAPPTSPPAQDSPDPFAEPLSPVAPRSSVAPVAPVVSVAAPIASAQSACASDLMDAFLAGANLPRERPSDRPADPDAAMRALGAAFRATVSGLRQAMIARAAVKGEFRIEQTMIRARGNNPLKFSADDDDALSALLGTGRRTDVTPAAAVADALRDIRLHELATVAAIQSAVRALLERLAPELFRAEADAAGRTMLAAQKRARAFDLFETRYGEIVSALTDDFDSVFGRAFARAYETALRDAESREA